jgi:membrane protein YdbS with pleckstrin-like domain
MNILISRDDKQLGPFSKEEVQQQLETGILHSTDWAWTEGLDNWVPLRSLFSGSPQKPPSAPPSTSREQGLTVEASDELSIWAGSPSQILNLRLYIVWGVILAGGFTASFLDPKTFVPLLSILVVISSIQCGWAFLTIKKTEYLITNQRVRIRTGILNKKIQEIELFRVRDTSASQTLFQRIFSLGNIQIISGDDTHPNLLIRSIPNALETREKIRQEVLHLRQKLRVREMDVM